MQTLRNHALAATAAATVLLAASALAQTAAAPAPGPGSAAWQPARVIEHLQQAGYTNVHDVDWDDGAWEVDATNAAGRPVDLRIDPSTGTILHEELD